jgi:hypothetical protein
MSACPRCGTENQPPRRTCAACGGPLPESVAPPKKLTRPLGLTIPIQQDAPRPLGLTIPIQEDAPRPLGLTLPIPTAQPAATAPPPTAPPAADNARGKQTLLGLSPVVQPPPAPAPVEPVQGKRTMLGMPSPISEPPPPGIVDPAAKPGARTVVGLAAPPEVAVQKPPSNPPPPKGPVSSQHKTIMGVARPGIAPLNPGVAKQQPVKPLPAAGAPPPAPPAAPQAAYAAPSSSPPPAAPVAVPYASEPAPPRRGMTVAAIVSVALALLLLVAAVVAVVLFLRGIGPIRAQLVTSKDAETLELTCEKCPDGTVAAVGAASAVFSASRATLPLERPLGVGKNELVVAITRPGSRSPREVKLEVPVDYRVRGDLSGLGEPRPKLLVEVTALKDTAFVIDGNVVKLDAEGKGRHAVDVHDELSGTANATVPLERKLSYVVTAPAAQQQNGEITFRIGIVPLALEAPGASVVVDQPTFMLAGRTLRGGAVTVADRPITVDASGRFAQPMTVSSTGETSIVLRASAPNHAPRLVSIRVRRVLDLADEAKAFKARATTSYAELASDPQNKRGNLVALDGEINELKSESYSSVILLEVRKGCSAPPCLVRVVHGARLALERRDRITVCGQLAGAVEGPRTGTKIPEVTADFVVQAK